MGPRIARPSHASKNDTQNEGAPPSTYAAQIVENLTRTNQQLVPSKDSNFRQLLQEILDADGEEETHIGAIETNVEINCKLIYVTVRAGLEVLQKNNPFDGQDDLQRQALNSLAVISLTIRRFPEVLFFQSHNGDFGSRTGSPLFLWLVPQLLNLLGHSGDEEIQKESSNILSTCLSAQTRANSLKTRLLPVQKYLQGCVKDILFLLESPSSSEVDDKNPSKIYVPTLETILEVYPDHPLQNDMHVAFHVKTDKLAELFLTVLQLLSLLVPPIHDGARPAHSKPLRLDYSWLMDCFTRCWGMFNVAEISILWKSLKPRFHVLFLDTVRAYVSRVAKLKHEIIVTSKATLLLSNVLSSILLSSLIRSNPHLELMVCQTIFDLMCLSCKPSVISEALKEEFLPLISEITQDHSRFKSYGIALQQSLMLAIHHEPGGGKNLSDLPSQLRQISFPDKYLQLAFQQVFPTNIGEIDATTKLRPRKRPRISDTSKNQLREGQMTVLNERFCSLLGLASTTTTDILRSVTLDRYPKLSEDEQCSLFAITGQLACTGAQTLASLSKSDIGIQCLICDSEPRKEITKAVWNSADSDGIVLMITSILQLPQTQRSSRPRVSAMSALKRLLSHSDNADQLNLAMSPVGQWCLSALHSSIRDLRVAAGRTLTTFLCDEVDERYLRQNRITALDHLRNLSDSSRTAVQETCILAWGQIARISGDDEINIVLLRLIEYLGHTNLLICGIAYDELLRISSHSSFTAMRLFSPYWRTVSVDVVRHLQTRPQIAQYICDLLNIKVPDFLRLTQLYTIPFLVLTKKRDVLQRIADACDSENSIESLCMTPSNMAAILAYLLVQPSSDVETVTIALLSEASPGFGNVDLADLVRPEAILIATDLLKAAGEEDDSKKLRIHQALQLLATLYYRRGGSSRSSARKNDVIGPFFETFVLGIMTLLSDIINDAKAPQLLAEKRRCIRAITEMIKLAKSHVSIALPQICACLRSAIENQALCNRAFDAWATLVTTLGEEDIESLVDPTFAIIVQHWESFDAWTQKQAHDMISQLLKSHSDLVRDMVNTIPSLGSIPLMSKFEDELGKLKSQMDARHHYLAFCQRCRNENATVVMRALIELEVHLVQHQDFLHTSATAEQPDTVIAQLVRSILDACVRFSEANLDIAILCAKCLGLIGCLDPTRIEAVRERKEVLILSNLVRADEAVDFVVFFLQEVLVKAFLSATNTKAQGFLAYTMQELLRFCELDTSVTFRGRDLQSNSNYHRWVALPESVRNTLTPFLTSKYILTQAASQPVYTYPLYRIEITHANWLRTLVFDLLQKGCGDNAKMIFPVFQRVIRGQDISISNFLLPFVALNILIGGTESQKQEVVAEIVTVLSQPLPENPIERENLILCSQNIFQVLDYVSRWVQEKKKENNVTRNNRMPDFQLEIATAQIQNVEGVLSLAPADIMSRRAVDCKSYARALFYWERYIQQKKAIMPHESDKLEPLYERLQEIYTQIDEPDGIEGISAHLQVLNIDQQVLEHRKAGRWTAVQSWYELLLTDRPYDLEVQLNLLTSLKESGQFDVMLNQVEGFPQSQGSLLISMPFAMQASWATGKWDRLSHYLSRCVDVIEGDFNVGIGSALLALNQNDHGRFTDIIERLRLTAARSLSLSTTTSFQACHDTLLQFHVLTEIESISGRRDAEKVNRQAMMSSLNQRLDVLGAFPLNKQYLLGLRRATMQLSRHEFSKLDLSSAWLTSARLARKGNFTHQAFNAVLHASQLGDESATIEHSKLLWKEGHHRKAILSLEGVIAANAFRSHGHVVTEGTNGSVMQDRQQQQNILTAQAQLLLAKWMDKAGQTQSDIIIQRYSDAVKRYNRWEKGHYYLGKHYNKLLDSEKTKSPAKQAQTFITGETAKLVIENYLRSLAFGAKYIYQTLPRILTLWLELGTDVDRPLDPQYGNVEDFRAHAVAQRKRIFEAVNRQIKKYIDRLPAFVFYTAFAQIVARICHTNQIIYGSLVDIVAKIVTTHPQQAIWTLLATVKSSTIERSQRGRVCATKVTENAKKFKTETAQMEIRTLMMQGQKLSDQLLRVCEEDISGKASHISITKDLGFSHKVAPCRLVIPLESTLIASLPTITDNVNIKAHKAFSKDTITISTFLDDVLILNSIIRPRKINVRGSDGRVYGLLCKPKDDLRKDQRLMEFNAMINRSLKRDAESSKRRLYIKTYAVTPLNETCGLIEWVDNLKTFREILIQIYTQKGIKTDWSEIRLLVNEASSDIKKLPVFTDVLLNKFKPAFHEWFVEMFPEPSAWFSARLKYTRSCAVMSIVGHALGLGDRHTENILFEEGNGGTFHVDFNCLFDKGLTFEKPELVPFRLTHNMIDAFGAYGYDGPFRKSCELTLEILRQNEDTLMTILETFLYDPTTDFIGKKKKSIANVPNTPEEVLESVRNKVRGLLPMESVPLSVEGYVQELIRQATDPWKLANMYAGWCAWF